VTASTPGAACSENATSLPSTSAPNGVLSVVARESKRSERASGLSTGAAAGSTNVCGPIVSTAAPSSNCRRSVCGPSKANVRFSDPACTDGSSGTRTLACTFAAPCSAPRLTPPEKRASVMRNA